MTFFYFSKLNLNFFIICVANFFPRSRELEPQTEPVARPGAGDGQSWTGSKTLGPRDPNPTNNGTGTAQRDKSKNWFWVRQATVKIIPVTFSEKIGTENQITVSCYRPTKMLGFPLVALFLYWGHGRELNQELWTVIEHFASYIRKFIVNNWAVDPHSF